MELLYKDSDTTTNKQSSLASVLWEATRPRMFPVWVSSGIIPATVAILNNVFDLATFVMEILLCWFLLTLSCWADEYGDLDHGVDNENRLGPHRPLQRGEITMQQMLRACIVLAIASAVLIVALLAYSFLRIPTSPWVIVGFVALGVICIVCAFTYTMGKHPYGYHGWGDFSAYFFFGPVACVGGFWLYAHTMDWTVMLPGSSVGIMLVVTINLQNIRDYDNDEACGKRTTAICLGRTGSQVYHYALTIIAMVCYLLFPIVKGITNPLCYLFVIAFAPLINHLLRFHKLVNAGNPKKLDTLMWPLCRGMLIVCVLFCVCMLLSLL